MCCCLQVELVDVLLDRLELATKNSEVDSPEHKREHQVSVIEENMLGTALTTFGLRGVPKLVDRIYACSGASDNATRCHFKALLLDCLTDTAGALRSHVALRCFASCLNDSSSVNAPLCSPTICISNVVHYHRWSAGLYLIGCAMWMPCVTACLVGKAQCYARLGAVGPRGATLCTGGFC